MKKAAALLLAALLLAGCSGQSKELERCIQLRTRLITAKSCSFEADITADYGDKVHLFSLSCEADEKGTVRFSVVKPDSISGIQGTVDGTDGALTFDDIALHIPLLADNQITPVCAPWLLMKTLRSGCITAAGRDGDRIRVSIDDRYDDDALHLDIWLDDTDTVRRAEIRYRERKILSLDVKDFRIQ